VLTCASIDRTKAGGMHGISTTVTAQWCHH